MTPLAEKIKQEVEKCVRCGTCRSACPTFNAIYREPASARGKIALVEARISGDVELGTEYQKHIKECALCGACLSSCPREVDTPELVMYARAESARKEGRSLAAKFALKNVLGSESVMPLAFKFATRLQRIFLKATSSENGLVSRFSLPLIGGGRLLPELPETPFMELPRVRALSGTKRGKGARGGRGASGVTVGLFTGCGVNYLMPGVGEAAIRVLESSGAEVVVPQGQVCCGMPALSSGEVLTARDLALKNLEVFESGGFDYITTACATCSNALKETLGKFLATEGPETRARVERFSSRVKDITELLCHEFPYEGGGKSAPGSTVTYHDPCHLGVARGIRDEPRELIERSGMTFREMKNPCKCCGLGGGLTFTNYELSMEIAKNKVESIKQSGAELVATACPGCIVQLRDALHRFGGDQKVVHVVELL